LKVHILGCYAATPRSLTNPTAQVLEIRNHLFLIDCGEGTQVQLRKNKVRFSRIKHIFISHLHGDHFFGLPGLIATFHLLGRKDELHIYGPSGIKEAILLLLKLGDSWTSFQLIFHELNGTTSELLWEDKKVTVHTIPLQHRVYTNGFLFQEKARDRKLNIEKVKELGIEQYHFGHIKAGNDVLLENGTRIANAVLTFDPPKPSCYAYCSDTAFNPAIIPIIRNADALYHESTFLEKEAHLAKKTKHSTAKEAAKIAAEAKVGMLILGHYSTRYRSILDFRTEAMEIFPNTVLGNDGLVFEIG